MLQAWRRTRRHFWLAVLVFVLGVVYGVLLPRLSRPLAGEALAMVLRRFAPLTRRFHDAGLYGRVFLIFANNLRAGAIMFVSGVTFLLPAFILLGNGLALGLIGAESQFEGRLTLGRLVLGVLPHGVFELPALFLLAALGWRLGALAWRRLLGIGERAQFTRWAHDAISLGLAAVALLLIAALVEVLVSPLFLPVRAI